MSKEVRIKNLKLLSQEADRMIDICINAYGEDKIDKSLLHVTCSLMEHAKQNIQNELNKMED